MILVIQILILVVLGVMGLVAVVNAVFFPRVDLHVRPNKTPSVSVLIPARNEEGTIETVLATLSEQEYPAFDVLVLDDSSTDGTRELAERWAARDGRIKVIAGSSLPEGWVGKCHACQQLADQARGDLLLFLDADTCLRPRALTAAVAELERTNAGLLSLIPHQRMESFWEQVVLPLLHFNTFCFLPMPLVPLMRNPRLAMANGQWMLFRRDVYMRIGGHASVRTAIVEDVWLSRRVKECGAKLVVRDGCGTVSARMYCSFREIWEGFSKNLFAGLRYSLPMISAMILFTLATSIGPFILPGLLLLFGGGGGVLLPVVLLQIALLVGIRVLFAVRFRHAIWSALLHPLAAAVVVGIALNSVRWVLGGGARWKGRRYDFRKVPATEG